MRHLVALVLVALLTAPVVSAAAPAAPDIDASTADRGAAALASSDTASRRVSALVALEGASVFRQAESLGAALPLLSDSETQEASKVAALSSLDALVSRRQEPVASAVRQLGARVVSRYTTAANGLLVHATPDQLSAIERLPGVARVEPAPLLKPDLGYSGPHVGATAIAQELGLDGEGTYIAVIDTGVDYTHAHLGGPGTEEAWAAAQTEGATETITDTFEGALLYPTDKVVGGWDFVGRHYDPPHICTPDREAAGDCTSVPQPDPDPLDGGSHGTHVSGISAGNAVGGLSDGVAPGAQLVGLKVYGRGGADEAADMVIDAIEWCARVNLGLEDRGVLPPRVDAINISLGESYAQGSLLYDEAVEAAVGAGVIVVASAGNSGNYSFVVGTPSASPKILSVANSLPPSPGLEVEVRWDDEERTHFGTESTIARPLDEAGPIDEALAWFGRACTDDEVFQDPTGKIALIRRGECNFSEKLLNAQAAGAIAVLMFTDNRPRTGMAGNSSGIDIPAVMIDNGPGEALVELIEDGHMVSAVLDAARFGLDMSMADAISGSSSRGPSKNGALKPDITAPGTGILSALRGSGTGGASWSGTSMSGPHVAGGAALMHNRNRAEDLGLGAADLAALLMNYSRPASFTGSGDSKTLVPVARQGAGVMDLRRSAAGKLLVRAGDLASLHVGATSITHPERHERTLSVRNLSDELILFTVEATMLYDDDIDRGLTVITPSAPVPLPAGADAELDVVFELDPARMRDWTMRPSAGASANALAAHELDGYITVTPISVGADSEPDTPAATVPFYVLPRAASAAHTRGLPAIGDEGEDDSALLFTNAAAYDGDVELFVAPVVTATGEIAVDPDEADLLAELDVRAVGVRFEPPTEQVTRTMLTFALARHEVAAVPNVTRFEVYLDVDRDGAPDHRVREVSSRGRMRTYWSEWDAETGAVSGSEYVTDTVHSTDLYTHLSLLSVPIERVGMTEPAPFDFYAVNRGLTEDWLMTPSIDVAPDGALGEGGPRYSFDPSSLSRLPETWSAVVPARGQLRVSVAAAGASEATLMALYPRNRFEEEGGQMQVLRPGDMEPRIWLSFLPQLLQRFAGDR